MKSLATSNKFLMVFLWIMMSAFISADHTQVGEISLEVIAENLVAPVGMAAPNDGTGRIFIIEQRGLVYIIDKNKKTIDKPFLDISKKIRKLSANYDERGLLGLAFHPKFKQNHRFFVYYSSKIDSKGQDHVAILAEYKADPNNPNKALENEKVILAVDKPEWNHNGGQILFDKKGLLYLGLGDGGGGGDKHGKIGNGQNLYTLLGKILRIDIDSKSPYAIPPDNPFVGKSAKNEIFAYGLRNPWRFSIDHISGRLFCADVGQNKYEEVNIVTKGGNYGWKIMEGLHCFEPEKDCNQNGLVKPIAEYSHDEGVSVTGGFVYRGDKIEKLKGKYVFGDWKNSIFILTEMPDKSWKREKPKIRGIGKEELNINSFGEDAEGELYILTQKWVGPFQVNGRLLKIVG